MGILMNWAILTKDIFKRTFSKMIYTESHRTHLVFEQQFLSQSKPN